jgi:hypothetical protein
MEEIEDVLSESCEELEILMEYLSLEDEMVSVDILKQYAFDSLTVKI